MRRHRQYTAAMSAPPVSATTFLPHAIGAAASVLDSAGAAIGWLDSAGRLRWANAALRALLRRTTLPPDGIVLDVGRDDESRWQSAIDRATVAAKAVHVPALRFGDRGDHVRARLTPLEDGGLLLEVDGAQPPAAVSVASSLRSLAHELKNPLSGLRGAAQLLSRRVLDADLRAYAEIIVAEVDRLSALTDRFLLPAGQSRSTAFNLHTVLERVRLLLVAEGVDVERDYDPSLPECAGDVDRLVQGVLNLARNAVESGSLRVLLRTRFERGAELATLRADALRLDVVDDGEGVPDRLRSTLFLPLVSGRDGGTGLGLATAHEIIVEHGGRIAFESRPGHTVFSVWLPLAEMDR